MNILILLDKYQKDAGASVAARVYIKQYEEYKLGHAYLYTTSTAKDDDEMEGHIFNLYDDLHKIILDYDIDVVHYFHSSRSPIRRSLLYSARKVLKKIPRFIPIVTTVCQRPSNKLTVLTIGDIRLSDHVVFIDNAAYNDALYGFIPKNRKSRIYFGGTLEGFRMTGELADRKKSNVPKFVYGRGSSLGKCPFDILEVFDKINVPNKEYQIAGVAKDSWLGRKAEGRNDVSIIPPVPFYEWWEICNQFDVFLYYLPEDAHSSIDGTLGDAMLMKIPPIVYGADAPKERIIHGVTGFVANTKEEIVKYAELLYNNAELRKRMGEAARSTQIEMFSFEETLNQYQNIYKMLIDNGKREEPFEIPLKSKYLVFKQKFLFSYWRQLIDASISKLEVIFASLS